MNLLRVSPALSDRLFLALKVSQSLLLGVVEKLLAGDATNGEKFTYFENKETTFNLLILF